MSGDAQLKLARERNEVKMVVNRILPESWINKETLNACGAEV